MVVAEAGTKAVTISSKVVAVAEAAGRHLVDLEHDLSICNYRAFRSTVLSQ